MYRMLSSLFVLALVRYVACACSVQGINGSHSKHLVADFSGKTAADDAQAVLNSAGFTISQFQVASLGASFQADTVAFTDGALHLSVRAQEGPSRPSAQIVTAEKMLYGSMRTVLKSSTTPGVCEGMFFYANDQAEIDWEILTHNYDVWATNRKVSPDAPETSGIFGIDQNPSADFHEYRMDWDPAKTVFYIDGVQQAEYTANVPQIDGNFILNVWSNGDPTWSAGPPSIDSHTFVRSIEIFTGYAPETSGETCTSALGVDVPSAENGADPNVMKLSVEKEDSTSSASRLVLQVLSITLAAPVAWAVQV